MPATSSGVAARCSGIGATRVAITWSSGTPRRAASTSFIASVIGVSTRPGREAVDPDAARRPVERQRRGDVAQRRLARGIGRRVGRAAKLTTIHAVTERVRQAGGEPTTAVLHYKPVNSVVPGAPDHHVVETASWVVYPFKAGN